MRGGCESDPQFNINQPQQLKFRTLPARSPLAARVPHMIAVAFKVTSGRGGREGRGKVSQVSNELLGPAVDVMFCGSLRGHLGEPLLLCVDSPSSQTTTTPNS